MSTRCSLAVSTLLLLVPALGIAAEARATRGTLIFWGNDIDPPYHFVRTTKDFVINGRRRVAPKAPEPSFKPPAKPDPRHQLIDSIYKMEKDARAAGQRAEAITAPAMGMLRASSLVKSVTRMGTEELKVEWREGSLEYLNFAPPRPPRDPEESYSSQLRGIVETLDAGGMVIIGAGYEMHVPRVRLVETRQELALVRKDPKHHSSVFPRLLLELLRDPVPLEVVGR